MRLQFLGNLDLQKQLHLLREADDEVRKRHGLVEELIHFGLKRSAKDAKSLVDEGFEIDNPSTAKKGFNKDKSNTNIQANFHTIMVILFLVVLILFSIVKTKIVHYSSMCYFPLTFLATYSIIQIINKENERKRNEVV